MLAKKLSRAQDMTDLGSRLIDQLRTIARTTSWHKGNILKMPDRWIVFYRQLKKP